MPTTRLGSRDLLEYDARYGLLICRECRYAIQKSALRSHLLRHKIYRGERQRLLSSIAQLDLLEPHQVPVPTPACPPFDALPIISGYRCTLAGCGNLCASLKRSRRHWSETHGLSEPLLNSSGFSRSVKLQTFFRGTKLRYFEVASSPAAVTLTAAPPVSAAADDDGGDDGDDDDDDDDDEKRRREQGHGHGLGRDVDSVTPRQQPLQPQRVPTPLETPPESSPVEFSLESLTYFYHFITTTSLTLPGAEHSRPATYYWQTDVVLQALRRRWLMCGLLAISACHLAALADNATIELVHRERLGQFFSEFFDGWEETARCDLGMVAAEAKEETKKAGKQMWCILDCAQWGLAASTLEQGIIPKPAAPFQLQSIMTTIQGIVLPDHAFRPDGVRSSDDDYQKETFTQAGRILEARSSSDAGSFGAFSDCDNTPTVLLDRLRALPFRIADTFGKPESARDVFATLSAIAALVECCDSSFASDDVGAAWRGMATWLNKIPEHFNHMVSHHSPAPLVVLAYWAALLVERAEQCGCWFLRGLAKRILLQITEQLPADPRAVQWVRSLMA